MIDPDADAFPTNAQLVLRDRLKAIDPDISVFLRPIRVGDPVQAFSVVGSMWTPDDDTWEMAGGDLIGATINRYVLSIQAFNQDMDEERGLQVSSTLAGIARGILSRDPATRARLASLTSTEFGYTERVKRFWVQGQRFLTNEIDRQFYHMSNLEFVIETEIQ